MCLCGAELHEPLHEIFVRAGRLFHRFDPRLLVSLGCLTTGIGTWDMTYFIPDINFSRKEKRKAHVRGRAAEQKEMSYELPGPIRP